MSGFSKIHRGNRLSCFSIEKKSTTAGVDGAFHFASFRPSCESAFSTAVSGAAAAAAPHVQLNIVYGRGQDLDQNLAGSGFGVGYFLVAQYLGGAELAVKYGFHFFLFLFFFRSTRRRVLPSRVAW